MRRRFLYGIGFGSAQPALTAATIRLAHPDRKGVPTLLFRLLMTLASG
ncbi:hypothetical protein PAAL109150_24100 [Paenibacillus alkaliterrae]